MATNIPGLLNNTRKKLSFFDISASVSYIYKAGIFKLYYSDDALKY